MMDWNAIPTMTRAEVRKIKPPQNAAELVACYKANLEEARFQLAGAIAVFRKFRDTHDIAEKAPPDVGFIFMTPAAGQAYAALIRWRSDVDHWHTRKVEAERAARGPATVTHMAVTEDEKREFVQTWKSALEARQSREPGEDDE